MDKLKIVVISGGTATNELVSVFKHISPHVCYILPISDNGGSTSEIIRVIGGPAIGDVRSRLTRLIPDHQQPLLRLLSFRLSSVPAEAKVQWNEIVDGTHELWNGISSATKEIFRAFFIHIHVELLKRSKHHVASNKKQFRYELANVGNLFLTGVRLFIGSLDSAIELFCKLTDIDSSTEVLPCINTNFTYHISALLENGLIITGQSQISHPSETHSAKIDIYPPPINTTRPATPSETTLRTSYFGTASLDGLTNDFPINEVALANTPKRQSIISVLSDDEDDEELGNVPQYTHPELKKSQLHFNKSHNIEPLLSPIKRIFYVSPYGQEICPTAPSKVTSSIAHADLLVYSIGSLMTSIIPIVILKGVGRAIASSLTDAPDRKKRVLLLNGCLDRETFGMTATNFIKEIAESATYSLHSNGDESIPPALMEWNKYVTHLLYMEDPSIPVDKDYLENTRDIRCVEVKKVAGTDYFDLQSLQEKLTEITEE
ncbi:conserved hypothetical protein [Scheffersomyces stipitis CBS 6054]|uniref:Uncharacterized protein n=1 Tax=Scheffersomyces stipitis (strain ATCC 58785 / CBS 6054 / NBRC 10063 / NRRL Y-11545) TaxID=322104 RepID=A3LWH6_PICST|nr:conserved hypothetical protein [Scheffersomyces stipitis CBS 6054]ABN67279.2 conserved hypothetical protein [Scheffersomyces stipitis CBS 6054]KAG2734413.1 hypothetical protein G9P44_002419 [Scheffersomyces stipitis]